MKKSFRVLLTWITRGMISLGLGLSAVLLSFLPQTAALEEQYDLKLLFRLRGEQQPPAQVVIVNIDRDTPGFLGIADAAERWPRKLHAELINRLREAGAKMIAFNVFFGDGQSSGNEEMAAAMRAAGSVVLTDYVKPRRIHDEIYAETQVEPDPVLAEAALANAPFLLPQAPEARCFITWHGDRNERPTFPVAILQLFLLREYPQELYRLFKDDAILAHALYNYPAKGANSHLLDNLILEKIERKFRSLSAAGMANYGLSPAGLATARIKPLQSLLTTLYERKPRYFNHYGAAGSFTRIPYQHILSAKDGEEPDLKDKIALVGFTENFRPETNEGVFYSPYSPISSVELAATAIANLLENKSVTAAFERQEHYAFLLIFGLLLGLLCLSLKPKTGIFMLLLCNGAYLGVAVWLFAKEGLWLPVILPLFWFAPMILTAILACHYFHRSREHKTIHSVIRRIIPVDVASHLVHEEGEWEGLKGQLTFGVCLASDAGQYTGMAETMAPMDLGKLMNAYYSALFPAVTGNGGWVSDVVGDAMMAIWQAPVDSPQLRRQAVRAALDMYRAKCTFEIEQGVILPIRIGLHCGEMRVGLIGASDHGEFRALGDTVNTAARLEGLCKLLGVGILVSDSMLSGLDGFVTRPLGSFLVAGKCNAVGVHELIAQEEHGIRAYFNDLISRFGDALAQFQEGNWEGAYDAFYQLAAAFPNDGPTRFYLETSQNYRANPPDTRSGQPIQTLKPIPAKPNLV